VELEPTEWQAATSRPGEMLTPEGQVRAAGAFARGAINDDPRLKPYRRSMWGTGLAIAGIGVVVAALLILVT
jgi:hypothetical protein